MARAITDDEWRSCPDVERMLQWAFGKAPERRLRLFALAWCDRIGPEYLGDSPARLLEIDGDQAELLRDFTADLCDAYQTARRYVDGAATLQNLRTAHQRAGNWVDATCAYDLAMYVAAANVANATSDGPFVPPPAPYMQAEWTAEAHARDRAEQADLLRELVAPPSLWSQRLPEDWLTWNGGTVPKLARTIHDDRRFDLMLILADALEEAGCTDAGIREHCRGLGPHVRGCWVIDLILEGQEPGR